MNVPALVTCVTLLAATASGLVFDETELRGTSLSRSRRQGAPHGGSNVNKTAVLAAAAAALFLVGAPVGALAGADEAKVKCEGVNSCKGHGSCATANNSCAGKNGCAGQGIVELTAAECDAAKAKAAEKK
jgi:hypothetical protein